MTIVSAKDARKISIKNLNSKMEKEICHLLDRAIDKGDMDFVILKKRLDTRKDLKRMLVSKGYKIENLTSSYYAISW